MAASRVLALPIALMVLSLVLAATPALGDDPPGFLYATLLNGVKLPPDTGELWLESIQAVNLPPVESVAVDDYDPRDGGKLWAVLSKTDGPEIARLDFYADPIEAPRWLVSSFDVTNPATGQADPGKPLKLESGDYSLQFYLTTGRFHTLKFSVSTLAKDNNVYYFLDGPWDKWGYLFYANADPSEMLIWKMWLRNKSTEPSKDAKVTVTLTRDADGKVLCGSREGMSYSLTQNWVRYQFDLVYPSEAMFPAADLLSKDGPYTLAVTINGEAYGTWKVEVSDGKLRYKGRAIRGEADPLTFVDGGKDAWWYEKES